MDQSPHRNNRRTRVSLCDSIQSGIHWETSKRQKGVSLDPVSVRTPTVGVDAGVEESKRGRGRYDRRNNKESVWVSRGRNCENVYGTRDRPFKKDLHRRTE